MTLKNMNNETINEPFLQVEEPVKNITSGLTLRKSNREGDLNRVSIFKNGHRGHINQSGKATCSEQIWNKLEANKEAIEVFMKEVFAENFKNLHWYPKEIQPKTYNP